MAKGPKLQAKEPTQSRSKALVSAILEATIRVLPKVGSDNVTTKTIAETAGVSVGSLYQYFPSKEALIAAVMDVSLNSIQSKMEKKIAEISNDPESATIEKAVDQIVDFALEIFLSEKKLIAEIFKRAPELNRVQIMLETRHRSIDLIAREIQRHYPGLEEVEYRRASYITANSLMGVVQTSLYDEGPGYPREELGKELKIMFKAYFKERLGQSPRTK